MRRTPAADIALGGVLAAVAVVIMCLGGLIPVATFVCPMLCCLIANMVFRICGKRIAWAWYGAVALLSILMGPDKEAAAVFLLLGFYPMVKPRLDRWPLSWLWKLLLFNSGIALLYLALFYLMGMQTLAQEYHSLGYIGLGLVLLLGNLVFFLLDMILGKRFVRHGKG